MILHIYLCVFVECKSEAKQTLIHTKILQMIALLNRDIKHSINVFFVTQSLRQSLVTIPDCMSWMNQFMNDFLSVGTGKNLFICK